MKMHDGEVDLDAATVARLVAGQFPELASLPISRVRSTGTVNAIYRLGDDLCARLPLVARWAADLQREYRWLPEVATRLTLQVPDPVALGQPGDGYPFRWALYRWIEGQPYAADLIADERQAARDTARFIHELRAADMRADAPAAGRKPLRELDAETREAIEAARGVIDSDAAAAAWDCALRAPAWDGHRVWIHADLMRPNLLVRDGRVAAVIDFGAFGAGDPAADVIPAWEVFGEPGQQAFRAALAVDDGTWARARGYALHQAAMIIPYYAETNPDFVTLARETVEQVLADIGKTACG
jgi:aminoglycoside phosphotransferase (APT) family kinase protein